MYNQTNTKMKNLGTKSIYDGDLQTTVLYSFTAFSKIHIKWNVQKNK